MSGRIIRSAAEESRLVLPRVGRLKVGKKSDKGFPMSVDYFIPSGKYADLFTQAYGPKPSTIQIVFPDDDPEKVCCERYEYRNDEGKLVAWGDGHEFQVFNGKKYVPMTTDTHPDLMRQVVANFPSKKGEWVVTLTLNFIVPLVRGVAGVWTFQTRGVASTIPQIRNVFDAMLEKRGFCKGILFDLGVEFAKSQKPGQQSRFPVVTLVPNESESNVLRVKEGVDEARLLSR